MRRTSVRAQRGLLSGSTLEPTAPGRCGTVPVMTGVLMPVPAGDGSVEGVSASWAEATRINLPRNGPHQRDSRGAHARAKWSHSTTFIQPISKGDYSMKKFLSIFVALSMVLSLFAGALAPRASAATGALTDTTKNVTLKYFNPVPVPPVAGTSRLLRCCSTCIRWATSSTERSRSPTWLPATPTPSSSSAPTQRSSTRSPAIRSRASSPTPSRSARQTCPTTVRINVVVADANETLHGPEGLHPVQPDVEDQAPSRTAPASTPSRAGSPVETARRSLFPSPSASRIRTTPLPPRTS